MFCRMIPPAILLTVALGLAGCPGQGSKPVAAKGKVVLNDKPVSGANVTFSPKATGQGNLATGTTDANGEFSLTTNVGPGALPGEYRVSVNKAAAGAAIEGAKPEDMMKMVKRPPKSGVNPAPKSEVPAKYASPESSGLAFTVTTDASKNVFEIKLAE